jgi:alpha-tubulin suppressor-like RCC1 family protein
MPSNYKKDDITYGIVDFDDDYVTEAWLVDQFVGNHLFTWGRNFYGGLGLGDTIDRNSPVQMGSLNEWNQVSTGTSHTLAIKTNNTLWAWGRGNQALLGLGNFNTYSSPVQVGSLTNWKKIRSRLVHNLAIKTDGTLWAWGINTYGQLGLGDTATFNPSPIQVGSLTNWKEISVGWHSSFAIKTDGTLWSWGRNDNGHLGLGDTISRSSPVQVGSSNNWKRVDHAVHTGYAIDTDGKLWAWGDGFSVNGVSTDILTPTLFSSLTNWKQISTHQRQGLAVKTDGTLWAWGLNVSGQLGLGNTTFQSIPVQVGTLTNWKQVTTRGVGEGDQVPLSAAVKTDGTLWAWGGNSFGQLGLGDAIDRSSPVQVGTLTNWKEPSTGANNIYAITYADIT